MTDVREQLAILLRGCAVPEDVIELVLEHGCTVEANVVPPRDAEALAVERIDLVILPKRERLTTLPGDVNPTTPGPPPRFEE